MLSHDTESTCCFLFLASADPAMSSFPQSTTQTNTPSTAQMPSSHSHYPYGYPYQAYQQYYQQYYPNTPYAYGYGYGNQHQYDYHQHQQGGSSENRRGTHEDPVVVQVQVYISPSSSPLSLLLVLFGISVKCGTLTFLIALAFFKTESHCHIPKRHSFDGHLCVFGFVFDQLWRC